jgi:hypothetical protein
MIFLPMSAGFLVLIGTLGFCVGTGTAQSDPGFALAWAAD